MCELYEHNEQFSKADLAQHCGTCIPVLCLTGGLVACMTLQGTEVKGEEALFETWLLLEYCDKGSLQNAVDRGWFRTDQHGHVDAQTKPNMRAIR